MPRWSPEALDALRAVPPNDWAALDAFHQQFPQYGKPAVTAKLFLMRCRGEAEDFVGRAARGQILRPVTHQRRYEPPPRRRCVRCGEKGPRIEVDGGYAHRRCIPVSAEEDPTELLSPPTVPAPPRSHDLNAQFLRLLASEARPELASQLTDS